MPTILIKDPNHVYPTAYPKHEPVSIKFRSGIPFKAANVSKAVIDKNTNFTSFLVYETGEYDRFVKLPGNRDVVEGHVAELMRQIEEENLLIAHPILVNEFGGLIDGQHRLEAARRLNVPIFFYIVPQLTAKHLSKLNSLQRNWAVADYVHSHNNSPAYKVLEEYAERYDLSISQTLALLGYSSGADRQALKNGSLSELSVDDRLAADRAGAISKYLRESCGVDKGRATTKKFLAALRTLVKSPDYDESVLRQKLKVKTVPVCSKTSEYLSELVKVYNFKNSKKQIIM